MDKGKFRINSAAVVGSGTMGSGIAALLAGVGIPVTLLDIAPRELTPQEEGAGLSIEHPKVRNRIVNAGLERIKKSRPAALFSKADLDLFTIGNLEDDFDKLADVDWVIEVIVENLDIKRAFFERLEATILRDTIVTSNTSGLPLHKIAAERSENFRRHFLGTHFFNPPRYLKLLELIPTSDTDVDLVEFFKRFGSDVLGKGTVVCKDTPSFIANRIGGATSGFRISYALENGYSIEEVDAIAGQLMGHPKTAVFRLIDLVGIDVARDVGNNAAKNLPEDAAAARTAGASGALLDKMVENGWLGNKTKVGFYKQVQQNGKKEFWPLDVESMEHVAPTKVRFESIGAVRRITDLGERLRALIQHDDKAARYAWHTLAFELSYAAQRIPEISDDIHSIDNAVRWGYFHEAGPFEIWDTLGVQECAERMQADGYVVPEWVKQMLASGNISFYRQTADSLEQYDASGQVYTPIHKPPTVIRLADLNRSGHELESNNEAGIFDLDDGALLLEFRGKANTIGEGVGDMLESALERLDNSEYDAMVIGNQGSLFSAGANIDPTRIMASGIPPAEYVEAFSRRFQELLMRIRYSDKPVVAAPFDRTLAGGVEITLAAASIVAHMELYMGLVEVGVGIIPGWGGCKEMLRRVVNPVMRIKNGDPLPPLQHVFETIGFGKVSLGAKEARELGFLLPSDRIVMDRDRLLGEAKREALHMAHSGYRAPVREKIYASGRDTLAAVRLSLFQLRDGNFITDHDRLIGEKLGWVLSGGDLSGPTWVDEQYILDLERAALVDLIQEPKTTERIMHMLQTGKPLRN